MSDTATQIEFEGAHYWVGATARADWYDVTGPGPEAKPVGSFFLPPTRPFDAAFDPPESADIVSLVMTEYMRVKGVGAR